MIQENVTLILFFILVIISLLIFFYYDQRRQKVIAETQFDILYNQITKEKILKEHYKKEDINFSLTKDEINRSLKYIRTEIMLIDFSIKELSQ